MFIKPIHNKLEALTNKMTKYLKNIFHVLLKYKLFKTIFQLSVGQLIHVYCTQLTVKQNRIKIHKVMSSTGFSINYKMKKQSLKEEICFRSICISNMLVYK